MTLSVNKLHQGMTALVRCEVSYHFLKKATDAQMSILDASTKSEPSASMNQAVHDDDSVYYRFCGAALSSMFHARYEKMRKTKHKQSIINREIQVLKCIQCDNKSHIPYELQYRDRGYMYFPAREFLDFIKSIDGIVTENANEVTFQKYGSQMIEVVAKQLEATQELQKQFQSLFSSRMASKSLCVTDFTDEILLIYKELSRKLCHTRLSEFMSVTQQVAAAKEGKATLAGQNLRDELLTLHVQKKTKIKLL